MPLVRLQVRNEFGLGQPGLYKETNREDPKAVLDGVAVAGLVGILRQLGDLADFAAEVFHGLQEQVMTTASRSHKLMVRVQNIEASLPPLEKAVLAQTSHIHFAYTAGYEWHPRIKTTRNHFIYSDLPQFIMDSYEECRDPPRLHVLDKFDTGGPGSCLRRYSDPTFFKRLSAYSDEAYSEKFERARKSRKSKKKRSSQRNRDILRGEQMHSSSGRMQFISPTVNGRTPSHTASTIDTTMKSDLEDHSNSFDSRPGAGYIECVFHPCNYLQPDEQNYKELSPPCRMTQKADTLQSLSPIIDDNFSLDLLEKQIASSSSGVTWDEKEEIVESKSHSFHRDKTPVVLDEAQDVDRHEDEVTPAEKQDMDLHEDVTTHAGKQHLDMHEDEVTLSEKDVDNHVDEAVSLTKTDQNDMLFDEESNLKTDLSRVHMDDIDSEPDSYMDALNTIESESENDPDYETKREVEQFSSYIAHRNVENRAGEAASIVPAHDYETRQEVEQFSSDVIRGSPENRIGAAVSNVKDCDLPVVSQTVSSDSLVEETGGRFPDSLHEIPALLSELQVCNPPPPDVPVIAEMTRDLGDSHGFGSPTSEQVPDVSGNSVLECSVGNGSSDNADTHNDTVVASIDEGMLSNGSQSSDLLDKQADGINNNITKPKETVADSATDHAVRFWTNGGLLGLEPSKPPVFTDSLTQASSITRNEMDGGLNNNSMLKSNGHKEEQELSAEIIDDTQIVPSSRCFTSGHGNQASITAKKSGSVLPVVPDSELNCTESNQGNGENSSRVFGFSHRFLINSFHQKVSFDEKSGPNNSLKTGILEQREQNGIEDESLPGTTFKTQASYGYPIDSLPPSPPLEHMKISFHPISGIETSKLKLKFPDGTNHHESIRDMFPAFQLVPEPSIHVHDSGSNSDDDDTFCRSSPYVSDDCRSLHSDYNSEQWESDETPESSDHRENESSHRISSTDSVSSSRELNGVDDVDVNVANGHVLYTQNDVEPSLSGPLLDFPSFDTVSPVCEQESTNHSDCDNIAASQSTGEPAPPPPLPPMQWRVAKPQFDITNDTHNYVSEDTQEINDPNPAKSNFSQQARPSQVEQENLSHGDHESCDDMVHKVEGKLDQKKLNLQKEANLVGNGKEMDEREDFLHQIITKSRSLRPTATGKPDATTAPTANFKVTAILEKASAIRQVVASDDDDTWSDM